MAKVSKDLLKVCRYYKGNDSLSDDKNINMCSFCEMTWCKHISERDDDFFVSLLDEYNERGLNTFNLDDGVPITLKSVLANRYFTYQERVDIKGFKEFYNKYYKERA